VTALDTSPVGLDKTREKAGEMGVEVNTVNASIIDYDLRWHYDVIFSSGALHYIPETVRPARFRHFREHTAPDGLHAFTVIVRDPNLGVAPDAEPNAYLFEPGELLAYYDDWAVLFYKDEIINCHSGGIPHQHAISRIIARRQ
jgi:tellurite methyltransferase